MIVKEVISEQVLTLAEAKEILKALRKSGQEKGEEEGTEEEEMRYERRKASEHTAKFAKLGAKESRALINELLALEKMKEEIGVRIADLMPKSKSEVRAIYAKERYTLTEANIEKILDCVAKYES
ncbi:RNA polymerase Rpb4 family protein [Methanophagales archaeon]|nr:RNA polymerase Rpb4 family protein [Methanophagales archaeon]RJS85898.1 MAG: RNA polymerase Rpb4 family protein [Methanophagales archaeon]RLG34926.1 MAG: RNA polymerase Rpb4 family protein [Methanosarcinales archaeon]